MILKPIHILLADDDEEDCTFFKEALQELKIATHLSMVHDGAELMQLLTQKTYELPHVLFLDLNIPGQDGLQCLTDIKLNKALRKLPVVIFTTSFNQDMVNLLYERKAQYYIQKPPSFPQLKKVIHQALTLIAKGDIAQPPIENFVLTGDLLNG